MAFLDVHSCQFVSAIVALGDSDREDLLLPKLILSPPSVLVSLVDALGFVLFKASLLTLQAKPRRVEAII